MVSEAQLYARQCCDTPKEISELAQPKTLIEDVGRNERVISNIFYKAAEWRKTDQWREGEVKSRRPQTNTELEKKELGALRTARVTRAGHGGDVLHSVVTKTQRNRVSTGRTYDELVTSQPSVERGIPHIWLVTAMLRGMENVVALRTTR